MRQTAASNLLDEPQHARNHTTPRHATPAKVRMLVINNFNKQGTGKTDGSQYLIHPQGSLLTGPEIAALVITRSLPECGYYQGSVIVRLKISDAYGRRN